MNNNVLIHKSAIVETDQIGSGSRIWAFVHVLEGATIGENANICDHCFIEGGVIIGDNVTVKCGVWLWDGVTIEDNVFVGPNVTFTNDVYPRSKNRGYIKKPTILREGCSIGANSTILAGVTIGTYAMVGAGSVVSKDVADYELVYGVPARHKGSVCRCGSKLIFVDNRSNCECGLKHYNNNGVVSERSS